MVVQQRRQNAFCLGGDCVPQASERRLELINVATEKAMDMVPKAVEADVDRAVAAARQAFESSAWSRNTPEERAGAIGRFVAALQKRCVAIARDEPAERHAAAVSSALEGKFAAIVP